MTTVVLGNRHAIESRDNGQTIEPMPKGKRATVVNIPEGTSLGEAFTTVTHPVGVWGSNAKEGSAPAWVASDSPGLAQLLGEHYGVEVRDLEDNAGGIAVPFPALLSVCLALPALAWMTARMQGWLKTNAGNDFQAAQMAGSASATAVAKWVALTANATAPAAADTTLTGEITTAGGGLIRKAGTYAHTTGAANYTITTVFTANGSDALPVTIAKRGIFDAASAGNMVFETLVSPTATLSASGDQLTLTDTISM